MEESDFIYTTNLGVIRDLDERVHIIQGGMSAGKTYSILPILIDYAINNDGKLISVVAETLPHLRRGAMRDFEKIMRATNRWIEGSFNKNETTYTFANRSKIEFFSADDPKKLRGARRDVLFINEANNVNFEAYQQLAYRTKDEIYIDFNPVSEFWAHTQLMDDPDSDFIILTYKGNEGCPESAVRELEKAEAKAGSSPYWKNWVSVYVYGQIGELEGTCVSNWEQVGEVPKEAELLGYGLDFGFTNDPTALVACYRHNGRVIWDEMIYETGLTNTDLDSKMKSLDISKNSTIFADSAEPKTIEELRRNGWWVKPVKKGADSINNGLDILNSQEKMGVTKRSTNLIKELRNYTWDTDKEGNKVNKPIDKWNHAIDAIRYYAMMKLGVNVEFWCI